MTHWTKEEVQFLFNNYDKYTNTRLAKLLNRSLMAIKHKLNKLGLRRSDDPKWKHPKVDNEKSDCITLHSSLAEVLVVTEVRLKQSQKEVDDEYLRRILILVKQAYNVSSEWIDRVNEIRKANKQKELPKHRLNRYTRYRLRALEKRWERRHAKLQST